MSKLFYESQLWNLMKRHKPNHVYLDRVEANMPLGLPDVQGTNGCGLFQIELKAQDQWKLGPDKLGIRPEQMIYLNKMSQKWSLPVYLFAKINKDFILVEGKDCKEQIRDDWISKAKGYWKKEVNWKEFYCLIYK